ncbi:CHAT domain-containing protein [Emticicia fontis]
MPVRNSNYFIKAHALIICAILLWATPSLYAQTIPTAPNQRNTDGKRIGEWIITYTKNWKETSIADSIAFYRKIVFDNVGKPQGKARDYYLSGALQFEGMILQIEPEIVYDGFCAWYYEDGKKKQENTFFSSKKNGIEIKWNSRGTQRKEYFENDTIINILQLRKEAGNLRAKNKDEEAFKMSTKARLICKELHGEQSGLYKSFLKFDGVNYRSTFYQESILLIEELLCIQEKISGKEDTTYAEYLIDLADIHLFKNPQKSINLLLKVKSIFSQKINRNSGKYLIMISYLSIAYNQIGAYNDADTYDQELLRLTEENLNSFRYDRKKFIKEYLRFISKLESANKYHKADISYNKLLNEQVNLSGENHQEYLAILLKYADFLSYSDVSQFEKSLELYKKALTIQEVLHGKNSKEYSEILINIGSRLGRLKLFKQSEETFKDAFSVIEANFGVESNMYIKALFHLILLYEGQSLYEKSNVLYDKLLEITDKLDGKGSQYEQYLDMFAFNCTLLKLYDCAYAKIIEKQNLIEKRHGSISYPMILNQISLARLYVKQNRLKDAKDLYLKCVKISEILSGKNSSYYYTSMSNLLHFYLSIGDYNSYIKSYLQINASQANTLIDFISIADQEQIDNFRLLKLFNLDFEQSISVGLLSKNRELFNNLYQSTLLLKGIQLQNTTQLLNYVRQSKDTVLLAQHERWLALKRSINIQNNLPITKRTGVGIMQEKADSLYKIMARRSVAFRNFKAAFQITPQAVQQQLKTQEAAIEFVHFRYYNGKRWTDSISYAALVLRKGWTAPRLVYLCEQKALDSLISLKSQEKRNSQYVERIYGYSNRGINLEKERPLRSLYTLLWQPLDSLLSGVSTIYYSPSGLLHRLNMAAIATPIPRQRLLDKYTQLIQLRSTREMVMPRKPVIYTQRALLMGGIEYNLDSLAYKRANVSYKQTRVANTLTLVNNFSRGESYNPLYATDEEISNTQIIMRNQKWKADTLKGLRASEEAFQYYAAQKPRVIHLATHGFFLEDTLTRRKRDKELRFDKEPTLLTSGDPMQRSGLVLAGGNHAWQGKIPIANQADGLLTASEIGAMVLNNTELAVLSACETGLGDVKGAEGVFGLQRAFKMAGVKYLLMSLWKVNDEITSRFMQKFYENWLTKKMSVRSAYQHTLKQFRQDHPNPYDWAAFVLLE